MAIAAADLVYPPRCAFCAGSLETSTKIALCADCRELCDPPGTPQCHRCAAELPAQQELSGDCARCRDETFQFDGVLSLGRYKAALREAVLRMKFPHEEPLMMALGWTLAERFGPQVQTLAPDVVVPIPMHWTRRLLRGSNSPEVMAAILAREFGTAFGPRSLRRKRRTQKLAELSRKERKRTLRDAFAIGRGCDFTGARVLLVDDVLTTGTTCDTAARVLKKAGAKEVTVLVAARAYPDEA